ncbi:MAG: HAD-IC family P-type ATPase, partial [Desulfuromusa sp.]|nr:HAD-IC family P-type ATPase [Desulfuromusa sp.]
MTGSTMKISVFGMTCQKCVVRVSRLILAFPEVAEVAVSLDLAEATIVSVAAESIPIELISAALYESGFETTSVEEDIDIDAVTGEAESATPQLELLRFSISGMSCATCASTIEKLLKKLPGIDTVNVNLAANFAQVSYEPQQVTKNDIFSAVDEAGFSAFQDQQADDLAESKKEFRLVLIAAAGTLPIMLFMLIPVFGQATLLINGVLATIVQFTAGLGFYRSAWKSLKNRSANMDVLVSLGITAAYGYSVLALAGVLGTYPTAFFETSAMLILFIRFGKWLESRAKGRAGTALKKLLQLQPDNAVLLDGIQEEIIPTSQVKPGDLLLVRPGEKIPVDGEVIEGTAAVDEAMITGEAVPLTKEPGSKVIGATINRSGRLIIKATHVGEQSVLAQIVRLVEAAQGDKPPIQRLVDRISNIFVPIVIILSLLTFIGWYLLVGKEFLFAFQMAIAVVVVACPCA